MVKRGRNYASSFRTIASAAKVARKMYNTVRSMQEDKKQREGPSSAITVQNDSKLLYRRRRAPKKVRRKARRRAMYHLRHTLNITAPKTNLYSNSNSATSTLAGAQDFFCIYTGLKYGNIGEDASAVGARQEAVGTVVNVYQNVTGNSFALLSEDQHKMYITGITTDYTISNISLNLAEVDVYEFVFRKDKEWNTSSNGTPLKQEFNVQDLGDVKLPGAGLKIASTDLGWTPFDTSAIVKSVVIKSKQRFYIGAGNTISFTKQINYKSPIPFQGVDFDAYIDDSGDEQVGLMAAQRGLTRGIIVVYKGTPGASAAEAVQLGWNAQSRYKVKVVDPNEAQSGFGL